MTPILIPVIVLVLVPLSRYLFYFIKRYRRILFKSPGNFVISREFQIEFINSSGKSSLLTIISCSIA
jgi:hypothetical protein